MITPDALVKAPARVSIFERLVPSLGFAVAAISGVVGALMILRFFSAMREAETAGYAAFYGGVAEIEFVVGIVLVFAAVLCGVGILISIIRLFTTNTTSSPPGIFLLMLGLLSLVPPFAIHYVMHWMKEIVGSPTPTEGGISTIADTIVMVLYFAIGLAALSVISLIAFSFLPLSSKLGKKASPLICIFLVEILIVALAGINFWGARNSIAERDKDREPTTYAEEYSDDAENSNSGEMDIDSNASGMDDTDDLPSNTAGNSKGKTISGGVLNSKAISLPEPAYPAAARAVRASGAVNVQVTVNEKGEVVEATAVSGHPLLRAAAVQAARSARFKPTLLSGQSVKVTGVITYNFSLQ